MVLVARHPDLPSPPIGRPIPEPEPRGSGAHVVGSARTKVPGRCGRCGRWAGGDGQARRLQFTTQIAKR